MALLLVAFLFGGMTAFSAGFATVLFKTMPMADARRTLRRAFPHYYLSVIVLAAVCAVVAWIVDPLSGALLLVVAVTTVAARQALMPRINAATDRGDGRGFAWLHGGSVALQLLQIGLAGWALLRIV